MTAADEPDQPGGVVQREQGQTPPHAASPM
jgi:hypothetical protein